MRKSYITFYLLIFLASCGDNPTTFKNDSTDSEPLKKRRTLLTTSFNPAFLEHSTVIFSNDTGAQKLSILISCNRRMRSDKDTFFYKTKLLTQKETEFFDTTLIKMLSIPVFPRKGKIVDGIGINFDLTQNGDSLNRDFHSPNKSDNPVGFIITTKAINGFKNIFNDEIISDYFEDINTYLVDSVSIDTSKQRAIFKLRQKKYGR